MARPNRSDLRDFVMNRSGGMCEWSLCPLRGDDLSHIRGIGRGGNPDGSRDTPSNAMFLCRTHHDILDGRVMANRAREVENLLLELNARRHPEAPTVIDAGTYPI